MVTITLVTAAEFWSQPNIQAILEEYALECSIAGLPAPAPSRELYAALESSGAMRVLGAFLGGTMIGFAVLLVTLNPHYGKPLAVTESLFVAGEYRKTGAGVRLLRAVEAVSVEMGAIGLLVSAPIGGRAAEWLPSSGYRETNRVFFRGLE